MTPPITLADVIARHAQEAPDRPALLAPGSSNLTYGALTEQVESLAERLRGLGLGPSDRVAVVFPNGLEAAIAFLGVSSACSAAPLNPDYTEDELVFYLRDLGVQLLLLPTERQAAAVDAAANLDVPIVSLASDPSSSEGLFDIETTAPAGPVSDDRPADTDVALALHTSGTTSRPKLVPLTHANLLASATNISRGLALTPMDRALNVMPLFHVHGLIGVLVSSLFAGGSVVCAPGLEPDRFTAWLEEYEPTWYSAVPTIHRAVVEVLSKDVARLPQLRFVRSSSAALPPGLLTELEAAFDTPVLEAYGMTEGSHQLTTNLPPPERREPGSVGVGVGVDVTILSERGGAESPGVRGEIAVRGANVMAGYQDAAEANEQAFDGGWFRTGDQGYLDATGRLFITGRLKELVNRGGEKVAPREVDEALLAHPAVEEVVAFAVPHPTLGEDLAAAVVPTDGAEVSEREIREFVGSRLADFKVPSQVLFVSELPKGPTGKLQRIGLADRMAEGLRAPSEPPRGAPEELVASVWEEVLGQSAIGALDNFFRLGGDSLAAGRVAARLEAVLRTEVPLPVLFGAPTVREMAAQLAPSVQALEAALDEIDALSADELEEQPARPAHQGEGPDPDEG